MGCRSSKVAINSAAQEEDANEADPSSPAGSSFEPAIPPANDQCSDDIALTSNEPERVEEQPGKRGLEVRSHEDISLSEPERIEEIGQPSQRSPHRDVVHVDGDSWSHPFVVVIRYLQGKPSILWIEHRKISAGVVHFITESGQELHDFGACRYLCRRHCPDLLSNAALGAAIDDIITEAVFRDLIVLESIVLSWRSNSPEVESIQILEWHSNKAINELGRVVARYTSHLERSPYLCGDAKSLADVVVAAMLAPIIRSHSLFDRIASSLDPLIQWSREVALPSLPAPCVLALSTSQESQRLVNTIEMCRIPIVVLFDSALGAISSEIAAAPSLLITETDDSRPFIVTTSLLQLLDRLRPPSPSAPSSSWVTPTGSQLVEAASSIPSVEGGASAVTVPPVEGAASAWTVPPVEGASSPATVSPVLGVPSVYRQYPSRPILTLGVCLWCRSVGCVPISAQAVVAVIGRGGGASIIIDPRHIQPSQGQLHLTDHDLHLTEAPAIMRYWARRTRTTMPPVDWARADDRLTWAHQKLSPIVDDFRHSRPVGAMLHIALDFLGDPPSIATTIDIIYCAAVAKAARCCRLFDDLAPLDRDRLVRWANVVHLEDFPNMFDLQHRSL